MLNWLRDYLARLGSALFNLLSCSWRIRIRGELPQGACVVAFWHGDRLPVWKHFAGTKGATLITPDGPSGPRHKMKPEAVLAAHRAAVPLVLCRVHAGWAIHGKHWDHILIPLPFARIELELVTLDIAQDADRVVLERLNTYAENLLKNLTPLL